MALLKTLKSTTNMMLLKPIFKHTFLLLSITSLILLSSFVQALAQPSDSLLYADDFSTVKDSINWITEIEQKAGANSSVYIKNGALILDTRAGVTVWYNKLLPGNIRIEFDRVILVDTGKNDRLSDCNVFWMAQPSVSGQLPRRNGKFESYDDLQLYYVGMGGNTNTTTRFRKYVNVGNKPVIQEHLDPAHLLKANKIYHITILVQHGTTSYWVNGERYFYYEDPSPLLSGYFGFRSTWSRQEIRNFRVYQLK